VGEKKNKVEVEVEVEKNKELWRLHCPLLNEVSFNVRVRRKKYPIRL